MQSIEENRDDFREGGEWLNEQKDGVPAVFKAEGYVCGGGVVFCLEGIS